MQQRPKVIFVMDGMSHYRMGFLELLRDDLAAKGVDFELIYGLGDVQHNIAGEIPWATKLPLNTWGSFSWLPILKATRNADLVVIAQVLRQIHLYPLLWRHSRQRQKIALWGHGKVFSTQPTQPWAVAFRYWVSRQVHWWFAYTEKSARVVREEIYFDPAKVTRVNNAIDTRGLRDARQAMTPESLRTAREALGIQSENVCLFMGGMYKTRHHDKRLPFLIEACVDIRRQIPDFEMIFIGGGPESHVVAQAAASYPWIHNLGIKKGDDTIPYWVMSKWLLVPGAVGLVVLDSFATGTPLITTNDPCHGPEIFYLRDNINGVILQDWQNPLAYAALVVAMLRDESTRQRLAAGCREDSTLYTKELMVENFSAGVIQALHTPLCEPNESAMSPTARAQVAFLTDGMSHYREAFYILLQKRLAAEHIELNLIYGTGSTPHNIAGDIPWAHKSPLKRAGSFLWLPSLDLTRDSDLVILPQVLRHLHLYAYLVRRLRKKQKIALWGHGKMYSARPMNHYLVKFKEFVSRRCDWWFAYTERSTRVVNEEIGYPAQRITTVNNAVDTRALAQTQNALTVSQLLELRARLGMTSSNVGIFVGGMYHNPNHTKRLPFLVDCCLEIRKRVPNFEMIFVGGGPEQHVIEQAAAAHPWMHYVGIQKGVHAVPYWALAKVCLNPGLVGLGILDCLAVGVPLITSNVPYHSPEIHYLKPGVNGLMINDDNDPRIFADNAIALMADDGRRAAYAQAGRVTVMGLTNEAMVEHFTQGILGCLELPALVGS